MKRFSFLLAASTVMLASCAHLRGERSIEDLTARSAFIFAGTVKQVHASTLEAVKPSDRTVVVRVDSIIDAPQDFGDFTGREITVRVEKDAKLAAGDARAFFTNGWIFGQSIAVEAVGTQELASDRSRLETRVLAARTAARESELSRRLDHASLIVVGKVEAVAPIPSAAGARRSEHDPAWALATLRPESVLKGPPALSPIEVRFAASNDVAWWQSPKLRIGDEGIWILHVDESRAAREAFTVLDPLDYQPRSELALVQRLLALPK